MKILVPFAPHLAYECFELLKCKTTNVWPTIDKKNILDEIKMAIQINGKTRDIIEMKKDQSESEITKLVLKSSKAKKYVEGNKILKTIFVKNRIINFIINKKFVLLLLIICYLIVDLRLSQKMTLVTIKSKKF